MGARGPRPEPTALKIAKGNPGRRAINAQEPQPEGDLEQAPEWLSDEAREHWQEIAGELERIGVLTSLDGAAFATYCHTWARWRAAERDIEANGETALNSKGDRRPRAIVGIARDLLTAVLKYQREFGLTPSARSLVKVAPAGEQPQTPEAAYFNVG